MATQRQAGGRISKRAIIRDPRGLRAAEFTKDIADKGSKMYDQATKASLTKKLGMRMLTKEALAESQAYRDIAKDIAKVNPSLDKQILAEIENNARRISDAYMKAYSPDGTPEDMIAFQTLDNNLTGQLNDLTMMIGAMDTDLEAYDLAKEEGRLIKKFDKDGFPIENEDYDLFRYGLTSGESDVKLDKDKDGNYILSGRNPAGSTQEQIITIKDYSDNLKKGGSFKAINPNMEGQAVEFGDAIIKNIDQFFTKKVSGQKGGKIRNQQAGPEVGNTGKDAQGRSIFFEGVSSFKDVDPENVTKELQNYFDKSFSSGFKKVPGIKNVPNEEEFWEYLVKEGYTGNNTNSWATIDEVDRQKMLNDASISFVEDLVQTGRSEETLAGKTNRGSLNSNNG